MNRSDSLFAGPASKGKTPDPLTKHACKTGKRREKSFVIELRDLKREIDNEIRQDLIAGRMDAPTSAHKKSNMSTLIPKKEPYNMVYHKPRMLNQSANFGKPKKIRMPKEEVKARIKKHRAENKSA